jgi:putative CRISPR-associated protein (TIGR02619 family)
MSPFLNVIRPEEGEWRGRLNRLSNAADLSGEPEAAEKVDELELRALELLETGDVKTRRLNSAELNGIYGLYENRLSGGGQDVHCLIATDTALGMRSAALIERFLQKEGINVTVFAPTGLNTASIEGFSGGMKQLLMWCEKTIPGYRDAGYEVVFNLTAAFKSLQGYLNIVGMFYADRMVYIFEGSDRLLSIPQLPIQIDTEGLKRHADKLALLAANAILPIQDLGGMPEGLLDTDEQGSAMISDWGLLVWNRMKHRILGEKLIVLPNLTYEASFEKDFANASAKERIVLQETLASASAYLLEAAGDCAALKRHGGLQYDNYTGKKAVQGRPIGHFRVTQGVRVSCLAEDGVLNLRHFGAHDYVNDNP